MQGDFSGPNNFLYWMVAIIAIGSLGYVKELRTLSHYFLALILLAILLTRKTGVEQGITFFSNLVSGISQGSSEAVNPVGANLSGGASGSSGGGSNSSGLPDLSGLSSDLGTADTIFNVASVFGF